MWNASNESEEIYRKTNRAVYGRSLCESRNVGMTTSTNATQTAGLNEWSKGSDTAEGGTEGSKVPVHLLRSLSCGVSPTLLYCTANHVMHLRDNALVGSMDGFQQQSRRGAVYASSSVSFFHLLPPSRYARTDCLADLACKCLSSFVRGINLFF